MARYVCDTMDCPDPAPHAHGIPFDLDPDAVRSGGYWPVPPEAVEHARLAVAETADPCTHGHYDCAATPAGPCSAESFAWLVSRDLAA